MVGSARNGAAAEAAAALADALAEAAAEAAVVETEGALAEAVVVVGEVRCARAPPLTVLELAVGRRGPVAQQCTGRAAPRINAQAPNEQRFDPAKDGDAAAIRRGCHHSIPFVVLSAVRRQREAVQQVVARAAPLEDPALASDEVRELRRADESRRGARK